MEGNTVSVVRYILHKDLCPIVVIICSTAGHLIQYIVTKVAAICLVTSVKMSVIVHYHVSTTAPALVSYSEILHLPRLCTAVLSSESCHRAIRCSHIFHPFREFFHSARADISADVRLAADHFTQVQELVCSE